MIIRTSIDAHEAQVGDVLDTFQQGRITVATVETSGRNTVITTTTGRVWRTSRTQLVAKIETR